MIVRRQDFEEVDLFQEASKIFTDSLGALVIFLRLLRSLASANPTDGRPRVSFRSPAGVLFLEIVRDPMHFSPLVVPLREERFTEKIS